MTKRDAAVDDGRERSTRRADRRVVAIQVGQFALAGAIALTIVGLATAIASRRIGEREAITDARSSAVIKAQGLVEPVVSDDLLDRFDRPRSRGSTASSGATCSTRRSCG